MSTRIRMKTTAVICVAFLTLELGAPAPARAQGIPVLDNSVLLQVQNTLSTVKSQLGQLTQITQTVQQIEGAIGQLGPAKMLSQIMGMLSSLNLGQFKNILSGLQPNLSGFTTTGSMSSALSSLNNAFAQAADGISSTKANLANALYTAAANPTAATLQTLTDARSANVREAAVAAAATGLTGRNDVGANGASDLNQLTSGVNKAADLRGDMQANSAILLSVLKQLQTTNANLSALMHLQGASAIAADSPTSSNGGQ